MKNKILKFITTTVAMIAGGYALVLFLYLANNLFISGKLIDIPTITAKIDLREIQNSMPSLDMLRRIQEKEFPDREKRIEEAADYFGKMVPLAQYPDDAYAWQGYCFYLLNRPKEAVAAYQKAKHINPLYFWYHHNSGVVLFKNRQYDQALVSFERALKTNPYITLDKMRACVNSDPVLIAWRSPHLSNEDHSLRYNDLLRKGYHNNFLLDALSRFHLKDYEGVLTSAARALQTDMDQPAVFYLLAGVASHELGRHVRALNFLNRYLETKEAGDTDADALRYLALVLRALGKDEEADLIARQAEILNRRGEKGILKTGSATIPIF